MNKSEFITALQAKTGLAKADVTKLVIEAVSKGEDVRLIGFGTFGTSERAARVGRNPHTGQEIQIPAGRVVRFSASANFKEAVK